MTDTTTTPDPKWYGEKLGLLAEHAEQLPENTLLLFEVILRLARAARLNYREREVLFLRHGIPDGLTHTQQEVGRVFKITHQRVSQVEAMVKQRIQQCQEEQPDPMLARWLEQDVG